MTESAATTTVLETPEAADRRAFEDALKADDAASRKKLVEGETVLGTIAGITPDVVLVSLGGKTEALMEKSELEGLKVGDRIEAVVVKAGPDVRLSRRLALGQRTRAELRAAASAKIPVQGKVTARNKGGFEVALGGSSGLRAFCPVSQIDVGRHDEEALKAYLGQTYDFRILEYTEDGRRIVVSRAALLREENDAKAAEVREKVVPGAVLKGRVRSITDFGAFVDLGGIDGLVHVTEISRRRIAHAKDALSVGQDVDVKVLKIEQEGKRISLSMKELESDPWEGIASRLAAGAPFSGKIARHADFGLFVELEPGIDGLVHVSQLPPGVTLKDEAVKPGETVTGWVKEIDPAHHRISLTLREVAASDPWEGIETKLPEGAVAAGEVENVAVFGVFVHLAPGLTGLIPNSETGLPHGTPASKSFVPGQKVEVKVIGLDTKRRRISLSVAGAKAEADRVDVKKYREESARREKEKTPAVSAFGASLLAALQSPKSKQVRK
ncbi:MAG TPA: S1 RNA-binding domain-containing protein [Thermoanaerobaculia bacterium]|nr:S1 RNA-binding domain-containing protein [Thermoanaerobaculia bacterium]